MCYTNLASILTIYHRAILMKIEMIKFSCGKIKSHGDEIKLVYTNI